MKLAFYGTLRDPDILERIAGTDLRLHFVGTSLLPGWACRQIEGVAYPALVKAEGRAAVVSLYHDCSDAVWQRLLVYEGDEYDWTSVNIGDNSYRIFVPKTSVPASSKDWTLSHFQRLWKFDYLNALEKDAYP